MSAIEPPDNLLEIRNATMRVSRIESNTQTMTANLEVGTTLAVSGNTTLSSNLVVGTANLFVDTVSSNVGVGTNLPLAKLDVKGDIGLVGNIYSDSNLSVQYTTENPSNTWAQVGGNFFGETASDRLGFSVAISADGLRIALGEYQHNSNAGRVIVFDWNGSTWIQAGVDIDGSGEFGYGISLSSDGKRLVVGAPGTTNGNTKVYDWSGSAWVQVGGDLTGTASGDRFGVAVSISGDKTRIVVGANLHDSSRGEAKIYEYHQGSATWVQVGSTLDGEATGDRFGYSLAMSSNGSRVAIGADNNDGGGTDAGHVRVFDWDGSVWTQAGADIDGESAGDLMGSKGEVSLSSDGLRLAVGARRDDATGTDAGHVRVFNWSGSAWTQLGGDIDGEAAGDEFGVGVALSPDGSRLAVGGHFNDAGGSDAGHVRVFEYIGGSWTQIGADLDGNDPSGLFGTAVALSSNGSRLVVGGPRVDGSNGSECGLARVFDYDGVLKTKQIIKENIVEIPGDLRAGTFYAPGITIQTIANNIHVKNIYSGAASRDIPEFDVVITPRFATSKILIRWVIQYSPSDANHIWRILRNGTTIGYNTDTGLVNWSGVASMHYGAAGSTLTNSTIEWVDTPNTTGALTYRLQFRNSSTTTVAVGINRTLDHPGTNNYENGVSFVTATELA